MEFSKLYVVDSVFITVLKITKCKNTKRKRMTISFYLFFICRLLFTWKRGINPFRYEIYNENLFCPAGKTYLCSIQDLELSFDF